MAATVAAIPTAALAAAGSPDIPITGAKPKNWARTEFDGKCWRVYDSDNVLRVKLGIW